MLVARKRQFLRVARRIVSQIVVALTLMAFSLAELPISIELPARHESSGPASCCAARLAQQANSHRCGCSLQDRQAGTCCCGGKSRCGRKTKQDSLPSLHACQCGGPETSLLWSAQPRFVSPRVTSPTDGLVTAYSFAVSLLQGLEQAPPDPPPPELPSGDIAVLFS